MNIFHEAYRISLNRMTDSGLYGLWVRKYGEMYDKAKSAKQKMFAHSMLRALKVDDDSDLTDSNRAGDGMEDATNIREYER
jgi:hypothetical protein